MTPSKVYFTDLHTHHGASLLQKLAMLIDKAGMGDIDFAHKFVAIKTHFGEPGNMAYPRPQYARVLVDYIKARGGYPFLTDCNTLYVGARKHALEHIDSAFYNGFSPFTTDCHVIIADGLKGNDDALIPIDGELVKQAKIGRALADADIIVSLSHFKGHVAAGFGGALKNLGMGGGSRAGKMEMHSSSKPFIKEKRCVGCKLCATACAQDAISYPDNKAHIDEDRCVGCGRCISMCARDAIAARHDESNVYLNKKIAEYALAVVKGKPHFHVSLALDISPSCDCEAFNDIPITQDAGLFASFDPVALDLACADVVNALPVNPQSVLREDSVAHDHFSSLNPDTEWRVQVEHGVKIGLGSDKYTLITV